MTIGWSVFQEFRRPIDPKTPTWTGVIDWVKKIEQQLGAERDWLSQRRLYFDRLLDDLDGDPTARDWTSFLLLRRDREEDWSDWLAQLLEESLTGCFARELFGPLEHRPVQSYVRPTVLREVPYEGIRADLVIQWTDGTYTHLEVKVGDPNLSKTLSTAEKIERRFGSEVGRRSDVILLLPTQVDAWQSACACTSGMRERVHCLTWLDIAVALRRSLPATAGESIRWRVWAHAFCGAIEQDLLGMRSATDPNVWARGLGFQNLRIAARLFDHEGLADAR